MHEACCFCNRPLRFAHVEQRHNGLGPDGAKHLAEALEAMGCMKLLYLVRRPCLTSQLYCNLPNLLVEPALLQSTQSTCKLGRASCEVSNVEGRLKISGMKSGLAQHDMLLGYLSMRGAKRSPWQSLSIVARFLPILVCSGILLAVNFNKNPIFAFPAFAIIRS